MLVQELIEKLQQMNPNAECMHYQWDWQEESIYIEPIESIESIDNTYGEIILLK